MENASDALMMAFGVLIFVLALTVAINSFSQAREVSDIVLYQSDTTNYYDYYDEVTDKGASQNRIVGLETIIPTLYKYNKEKYTVLFRIGHNYNEETGRFGEYNEATGTYDENIVLMPLYSTPTSHSWRVKSSKTEYWNTLKTKYSKYFKSELPNNPSTKELHTVFSFDLDEETNRNEPWTIDPDEVKKNLDCFLFGGTYIDQASVSGETYIDYTEKFGGISFVKKYANARFVEEIAEVSYSTKTSDYNSNDKIIVDTTIKGKKRVYIFTLIDD